MHPVVGKVVMEKLAQNNAYRATRLYRGLKGLGEIAGSVGAVTSATAGILDLVSMINRLKEESEARKYKKFINELYNAQFSPQFIDQNVKTSEDKSHLIESILDKQIQLGTEGKELAKFAASLYNKPTEELVKIDNELKEKVAARQISFAKAVGGKSAQEMFEEILLGTSL